MDFDQIVSKNEQFLIMDSIEEIDNEYNEIKSFETIEKLENGSEQLRSDQEALKATPDSCVSISALKITTSCISTSSNKILFKASTKENSLTKVRSFRRPISFKDCTTCGKVYPANSSNYSKIQRSKSSMSHVTTSK